jgi:uncharacterized repeat protein (TIGR01451 family)
MRGRAAVLLPCSLIGAGLLLVVAPGGAGVALAQAPLPAFVEIPNSPFDNPGLGKPGQEADSVVFSPDGKFLATTANADVAMFSVEKNGTLTPVAGSPFFSDLAGSHISQSVAFSPSGGFIAMAVYDNAYVVVFRVESDGTLQQVDKFHLTQQGQLRSVAFNPSGTLLAISHSVGVGVAGTNAVTTFSVGTGGALSNEKNYDLPANLTGPQQLTFNPSGTLLAVANTGDNTLSMFSVQPDGTLTDRHDTPLPAGSDPYAVAFDPSGTLLAVGSSHSSSVSVFSVAPDGTLSDRTDAPTGSGPTAVTFSPSGTLLATANRNSNNLSGFEVDADVTLTPLSGSPFPLRSAVTPISVAFSPIAPLLAAGNGTGSENVSVLSPPAALEITKVASASQVAPGHVLTYTVTVHNKSSVFDASGPVVDDLTGVLDQATLEGSPTASEGTVTVDQAAASLTWDGTLAPDGTATIHYDVRVDASLAGGLLADRVSGPPGSNCEAGAPAATPCLTETQVVRPVVPPAPRADLALSKTASTASAHPGGQVQYTLVVRNRGPDHATGVSVVDPTPPGLFVLAAKPSQGSCAIAAGQLSCTLGTLASGGQALVLVTARIAQNASGTVSNVASVFGHRADPDPRNNVARGDVKVTPLPPPPTPDPGPQPVSDLVITKHVSRARALVGGRLTYTITVANEGAASAPARDVRVTDASRLPLRLLSVHTSRGSCNSTRPVRCRLGTLARHAHATIRIRAVATAAGAQANAATVTSGSWDPAPDTPIALARTRVVKPSRPRFTG